MEYVSGASGTAAELLDQIISGDVFTDSELPSPTAAEQAVPAPTVAEQAVPARGGSTLF